MPDSRPGHVLYALFRYPQISQTFVRDEIHALRDAGVRTSVLTLDPPGPEAPSSSWSGPVQNVARPALTRWLKDLVWWSVRHPCRVLRFVRISLGERRRSSYMLRRGFTLARSLAGDCPDHLHTHFAWNTASVVAGLAELLNRPCTITVHAKDIYAEPPRSLRRRLSRFDRIVTVCHFNVGYLSARGVQCRGRRSTRVVELGVAAPAHLSAARDLDVVAVGRLVEKKGFDVLLDAFAARRGSRTWRVMIVGDGPLRQRLEDQAERLGIAGRVTFTGSLPHDEALAVIARGRVFCLPSRPAQGRDSDAMPVVLREAMAHGSPVIASRLAGIPESVDDSVGWLVEPGSRTELADALAEALGDAEELSARGTAARAKALERWTFTRQAAEMIAVFTSARDGARTA